VRPYSVAHLRAVQDGAVTLDWVRRTRIDGDGWDGIDVPLGEEAERYVLSVRQGGTLLRQEVLSSPGWVYGPAQQAADGATGAVEIAVAQVSDRFGPGPERRVTVML